MTGYHAYYISHVECNEIYLQSSRVLNQEIPLIITKQEEAEIQPFEVSDSIHILVNNFENVFQNQSK